MLKNVIVLLRNIIQVQKIQLKVTVKNLLRLITNDESLLDAIMLIFGCIDQTKNKIYNCFCHAINVFELYF